MSKRMTKRDAAAVAWSWIAGDLLSLSGGDAGAMERSAECWYRGCPVGGVIWEAVAMRRPWHEVVEGVVERLAEMDEL